MSLVTVTPDAAATIKSLLAEKGVPPVVRIELRFTGCCDPSLGLTADKIRDSDLVEEVDGLTFAVAVEAHELAGEVSVSCAQDATGKFVVTSAKPVSEWEGFAPQGIESPR